MKSIAIIPNVILAAVILLVVQTAPSGAQTNYQRLRSFGLPDPGTQPHSALLLGADGALYGTTQMGGTANQGTVFRLNVDGSGYAVLHEFSTNYDGKNPIGALIQGPDGTLYGSTVYGGSNRCGTVFSLAASGSGYALLHHFSNTNIDGQYPYGRLVQDSNGVLYGTTSLITNSGAGTVFKLNADGTGFALLHTFAGSGAEGRNPRGLIWGQDGLLYGLNQSNSPSASGGIFKISPGGTGFTAWMNVGGSGERAHLNALRQGTNGLLYGATCYGGSAATIFSIGTNGAGYSTLHTFLTNGVDGQNPDTQLLPGLDGAFYGTTVAGGTNGEGTIFRISGDGSGYAVLYHFKANGVDGCWPEDSLTQGGDGTLYGTTLRGGFSNDGTVYAINPDGTGYRVLLAFNSFASEGQTPSGSLAADGAGSLYGVTHAGGNGGWGTLYKIGVDGTGYSIVRHFGGPGDGQWPSGQLLQGQDGVWYGTTYTGGSNNCGAIFKINGDGSGYSLIHSFSGTNDGDVPYDELVQGPTGLLYGTTAAGGTNNVGTVFTLDTNGNSFAVLHIFSTNGVEGATPSGGVVLGGNGALYGLTEAGGTNNGGSIFMLNVADGGYATLYHFQTNGVDGLTPGGG